MKKIDLNKEWNFYESNEGTSYPVGMANVKKVDLPHDFIIGHERSSDALGGVHNAYFANGQGIYKKNLEIPQEWEEKLYC